MIFKTQTWKTVKRFLFFPGVNTYGLEKKHWEKANNHDLFSIINKWSPCRFMI